MSKLYRVIGRCKVAGVEPGGTVTRDQVLAYGGPDARVNLDALVGVHLEEVKPDKPEPKKTKGEG